MYYNLAQWMAMIHSFRKPHKKTTVFSSIFDENLRDPRTREHI